MKTATTTIIALLVASRYPKKLGVRGSPGAPASVVATTVPAVETA